MVVLLNQFISNINKLLLTYINEVTFYIVNFHVYRRISYFKQIMLIYRICRKSIK